jgi:HemY protein
MTQAARSPCRGRTPRWRPSPPRRRPGAERTARPPEARPSMRGVIWLVLLFVVAVVAATTLGSNDGLVSIYWGGWRTDLSLNLFLILLLGACLVLMAAAQGLIGSLLSPCRSGPGEWRALRRERAAQAALREALANTSAPATAAPTRPPQRAGIQGRRRPALRDDASSPCWPTCWPPAACTACRTDRRDDATWRALEALRRAAASRRGARRRRRRASAGRRMGAGRPRRARVRWSCWRAAARRRAAHAGAAAEAAGHAHGAPAAGRAAHGAPAGQAPGLLAAAWRRAAALAGRRDAGRTHDVQQLRRLWGSSSTPPTGATRRWPRAPRARRARSARRATTRAWLRPFWDRLGELEREDRERGAGADWRPRPASASTGCRAWKRRRSLWPRSRGGRRGRHGLSPTASSGARRAGCWSTAAPRRRRCPCGPPRRLARNWPRL